MTVPLLHQTYGGEAPQRVGLMHPSIAPYRAYSCAGGEQVVISIQSEREWANFCTAVLAREDLVDDPRFRSNVARCANRPALDDEIDRVFTALSREALTARLQRARIAFGAVNSVADLAAHPQLRRASVATASGAIDVVAPPVRIAGEMPRLRPVPALGEHGEAIRREYQ
jgi:crotonobetainyl-CoA:carnitine CoA-transferase CaiB-like acyl-CoA transferase